MSTVIRQDGDYLKCKCRKCDHESRRECAINNCNCCNLEDAYSLATKIDFEW